MKKFMLATVTIIAAFALASCKKGDRVCRCTYPDGSTEAYTIVDKTSKKQAAFACEGTDNVKYTTDKVNYTTDSKTCSLD